MSERHEQRPLHRLLLAHGLCSVEEVEAHVNRLAAHHASEPTANFPEASAMRQDVKQWSVVHCAMREREDQWAKRLVHRMVYSVIGDHFRV